MTVSAKQDLPIKIIFINALRIILKNYRTLLYFGWPYVCVYSCLVILFDAEPSGLTQIFSMVLHCAVSTIAVVHCHRVFLLPKEIVMASSVLRWGWRETKYLFSFFVMLMYVAIIAFFSNMFVPVTSEVTDDILSGALAKLFWLFIIYIVVRFILILPDAAVGNNRPLLWAWGLSNGQSLRLFILLGLFPFAIESAIGYLQTLVTPYTVVSVILHIIFLHLTVFQIALLSLSYQWLQEQEALKSSDAPTL